MLLSQVENKYNEANASAGHGDVSYSQCLDEIRAKRIKEKHDKYDEGGKDPVVLMMTDWYDQFQEYESNPELIPVFEKQVGGVEDFTLSGLLSSSTFCVQFSLAQAFWFYSYYLKKR